MKSDYAILRSAVNTCDDEPYPYFGIGSPEPNLKIELRDAVFIFEPSGSLAQIKLDDRILDVSWHGENR